MMIVIRSGVAGFVSATVYKSFKGRQYQACTVATALLYPGIAFLVFFVLDLVSWGYGSTQAVPLISMAALLLLWFGISVPLVSVHMSIHDLIFICLKNQPHLCMKLRTHM